MAKKQKKWMIGAFQKRPNSSSMLTKTEITQIQDYIKAKMPLREISRLLHVSRNTVKKYGKKPIEELMEERQSSKKPKTLKAHTDVIKAGFIRFNGNCSVLIRHLKDEHNIQVNDRTLRRFCQQYRQELKPVKKYKAYETAPGQHMQIDFAQRTVPVGGKEVVVHFFIAVLAYSRRIYTKAYVSENQSAWLDGIESAFNYYGGVPLAILSDNTRCLVKEHRKFGHAELTETYVNFCDYWSVKPLASAPYHPQGKGKCERQVRYVKENALVGREFKDFEDLNKYLENWCRSVSDERIVDNVFNGSKIPRERFLLEAPLLRPGKLRMYQLREETRHVDKTGLIRIDGKPYRVADEVINKDVQILMDEQSIKVLYSGKVVTELNKADSVYTPEEQITVNTALNAVVAHAQLYPENPLQRPLSEYDALMGGAWNG